MSTDDEMEAGCIDIHAHEILEMMVRGGRRYSNESLAEEVLSTFGPDARFYTCSGSGLDAFDIVQHLWGKGKFTGNPDDFVFLPSSRCDH